MAVTSEHMNLRLDSNAESQISQAMTTEAMEKRGELTVETGPATDETANTTLVSVKFSVERREI